MSRTAFTDSWTTEDIPRRRVVVRDRCRHRRNASGYITTRCRCRIRNRYRIVFVAFDESVVGRGQVNRKLREWIAITSVSQRCAVKCKITATCDRRVHCCNEVGVIRGTRIDITQPKVDRRRLAILHRSGKVDHILSRRAFANDRITADAPSRSVVVCDRCCYGNRSANRNIASSCRRRIRNRHRVIFIPLDNRVIDRTKINHQIHHRHSVAGKRQRRSIESQITACRNRHVHCRHEARIVCRSCINIGKAKINRRRFV